MSFFKAIIARDVDKTLGLELEQLKQEFEAEKEAGSPQYLEKLLALLSKEHQKFKSERPSIEKSIKDKSFDIVREDLLFRVLHLVKNDGKRKGANTIVVVGGEFTRPSAGQPYEFKGTDPNLLEKVKKKYSKVQYDQDMAKLRAMEKYFSEGKKAIQMAIDVRDGKASAANKLIRNGAGKLKPAKIMAFNQLPGLTCPGKGDCFNWCFALSGMTAMPDQMKSYAENLGAAERDDFVEKINKQLKGMRADHPTTLGGKKYKKVVRIHAYGDFHTPKYISKWRQIAAANPDVFFYAYTKSFAMKAMKEWLDAIDTAKSSGKKDIAGVSNVKIIQSYGSKHDDKINPKYPIAQVFDSEEAIKAEKGKGKDKCHHCHSDDKVAADPTKERTAIVMHGETPCAAGFCPYKKTTASCKRELPLIHLVDQIDMPHHMSALELSQISHLGPHLTPSEHEADFGRHMVPERVRVQGSFKERVLSSYQIS